MSLPTQFVCRRTGIILSSLTYTELEASQLFSNSFQLKISSIHPLFLLKKPAILEIIRSKGDDSIFAFTEQDQKLLLLAILDSMNMIQWNESFTANPLESLLIPALERVLRIAASPASYLSSFALPKIAISEPQDPMLGVVGFLDSIIEEFAGTRMQPNEIQESQMLRIEVLSKAVATGDSAKTKVLRASICAWVMEATKMYFQKERITKDTIQHWKEILKSSPAEVAERATAAADVAELEDFLISHLPTGSTASFEVLKHIEELKTAAGSLGSYLFGDNLPSNSTRKRIEPDKAFLPKRPMPVKGSYKDAKAWIAALQEWNNEAREEILELPAELPVSSPIAIELELIETKSETTENEIEIKETEIKETETTLGDLE